MKTRKLAVIFAALAFVLILIILNSVVFTVGSIHAYCYNANDGALNDAVVLSGGDMKGRNIFTLRVKGISAQIENDTPGVKVVNIERKFPGIVWINYVKVIPIFAFENLDGTYTTADNRLFIDKLIVDGADIRLNATTDEVNEDPKGVLIRVKASGAPVAPHRLEPVMLPGDVQNEVLAKLITALNRLDYREYDFLRFISEIDITRVGTDTGKIILTMRKSDAQKEQITIELWNSESRLLEKTQYAVTIYEMYLSGDPRISFSAGNTIKVYEDKTKGIIYGAI